MISSNILATVAVACLLQTHAFQLSGLRTQHGTANLRMQATQTRPLTPALKPSKWVPLQPKPSINAKDQTIVSAFRNLFTTCKNEVCTELEGCVPDDIEGTLFRNILGKYDVGTEKEKVLHPFDSDGMLIALQFKDGKAHFRNRFVQTEGYKKERNAPGVLFRNVFGTQRRGGPLTNMFDTNLKNCANTNVVYWGQQLLALWEAGLPYRMDPSSLVTVGEDTLGGLLSEHDGKFSAHPRVCATSQRLVNFAVHHDPPRQRTTLTIWEFPEGELRPCRERAIEIPGLPLFHDFIVTDNYYVFSQAPTKINPVPFLLGLKGPGQCVTADTTAASKIYLVPRDPRGQVEVVEVDNLINHHFANGFQDADGSVCFDVIRNEEWDIAGGGGEYGGELGPSWESMRDFSTLPEQKLERYVLRHDGERWAHQRRRLSQQWVEFPFVAPHVSCRQHRYVYGACGSAVVDPVPFKGLLKVDTLLGTETVWHAAAEEFVAEMTFVPREGAALQAEDDGYIAGVVSNGHSMRSELLLFDAKDIERGPVSRLPIPEFVPFGLHASFAPGVVFDTEEMQRQFEHGKRQDGAR